MDRNLYDQIINLAEKSQKVLILTHAKADCDGLGAALSMYLVLKEMGKEVVVVHDGVAYRIAESGLGPGNGRSDLNGDGRVDFDDFLAFARGFGRSAGEAGFETGHDLDGDGKVGFGDFLVFVSGFGTDR